MDIVHIFILNVFVLLFILCINKKNFFEKSFNDDLRKTIQNSQNLIYKVKRKKDGSYYYVLFEGKLAEKIGINTETVLNKNPEQIFKNNTDIIERINSNFKRAFDGEICQYETKCKDTVLYLTISPIFKNNKVIEIVGSAIDITALKQAEEQIRYMAYYDKLTGLPNRLLLKEKFNSLSMKSADSLTGVIFLDLDRFKKINDTLGHEIGDLLIQQVANRLKKLLCQHSIMARMGGDEFIILLHQVPTKEKIIMTVENIIELFNEPFSVNNYELFITTSIGIGVSPSNNSSLSTLIKNADIAMYRAKEHGRNTYRFYSTSMNERAYEKLEIETALRKALKNEEFFLLYQPRIDSKTGSIIGMEALIRWNHPNLGIISPMDFIPLAEETGLIIPIGEWVIYTACLQTKRWHEEYNKPLCVSVNISARQFQVPNLLKVVQTILIETKLEAKYLELEITENSIMKNVDTAIDTINKLKDLGVKISIDDFGTGFSSLSYLKIFHADNIKIDRSFVKDINNNPSDASIVTAIINMAHSLNMKVVTEGIETKEQSEFIKSKNSDEIQGYFFSRPITIDAFSKLIGEDE